MPVPYGLSAGRGVPPHDVTVKKERGDESERGGAPRAPLVV